MKDLKVSKRKRGYYSRINILNFVKENIILNFYIEVNASVNKDEAFTFEHRWMKINTPW